MTAWSNKKPNISISVLIAALIFLLFVAIAWYVAERPTHGLPYHDSFASGKADEWHSFGGTWEVADGVMRDQSNERGAKLITGSPNWKDYSIEGDMMLRSIAGYASDAGIVLRSSDEEEGVYAYKGYFALLHTVKNEGGSLLLGRVGQGPEVMASVPLPSGLQTQTWYHMKLLTVGCRLIASARLLPAGGTYVVESNDPHCLTHGRAGLLSSHAGGVWRNIVIRVATTRDADSMRAQIPAQTPATQPISTSKDTTVPETITAGPRPGEEAASAIPIDEARLESLISQKRPTISGQIILTSPELFVQDPSGGISIRLLNSPQLRIGDEVIVTGDVMAHGPEPVMQNASLRVLWEGTPIPAMSVTPSRIATGAYDGEYIEVEGLLTGKHDISPDTLALDFSAASQTYEAMVHRDRAAELFGRIEPQSIVRVRGVATRDPRFLNDQVTFVVLVRSVDDVMVVSGPPWWRFQNLVLIAGLSFAVLLAIGLLYRRIQRLKLLAVVQERERLAYEMHDTLAQSVAGIGFQLEAIRAVVPANQIALQKQLELAQELIRQSHAEARRSIEMLRPRDLQRSGLLFALKDCAMQLVNNNSVTIDTESNGTPRPINISSADALFRIGQEALANAVRHASPTSLKLTVEYKDKCVILSIQDNGRGFSNDPDRHTLGIVSMHKRAEAISAELNIRSVPGEGTIVTVSAPLSGKNTPGSWQEILRLKRVAS